MYKKYLLENKKRGFQRELGTNISKQYVFFFDDIFYVYADYLYLKSFFRTNNIFFKKFTSKELGVLFSDIYSTYISSNAFIVLCVSESEFKKNLSLFATLIINNNVNFEFNKQFRDKMRLGNFCFFKFVFLYFKGNLFTYEYVMSFMDTMKKEKDLSKVFLNTYLNYYMIIFKVLFKLLFLFNYYVDIKSNS